MYRFTIYLLCAFVSLKLVAQETFLINSTTDSRETTYAFINATIIPAPGQILQPGVLIIKGGKILSVGEKAVIPAEAIRIDLKGKFLYPGFVDPYTSYGLPEVSKVSRRSGETPQFENRIPQAVGWNEHNQSQYDAIGEFRMEESKAQEYRKSGITSVLSFKPNGVIRGTSVAVNLTNGPVQEAVLKDKAARHFAFKRGASKQIYPNSIMGMVALIRQTYLDAAWYEGNNDQTNLTLQAFNETQGLPQIFEANSNKLRLLVADKVGDEFGQQYIIKGNGDEYQRIDEVAATKATLILPLNFPDAYDVEDPLEAMDISLAMMKHWEMAPANPARLAEAGIRFAFTGSDLKKSTEYLPKIREAINHGLATSQALAAITTNPAEMMGVQESIGTLAAGKFANFVISSDDLFEGEGKIQEVWVAGKPYKVSNEYAELEGKYDLTAGRESYNLAIKSQSGKLGASLQSSDSTIINAKISVTGSRLVLSFAPKGQSEEIRLSGWVNQSDLEGIGELPDGTSISWRAVRSDALLAADERATKREEEIDLGEVIYPFIAFGSSKKPESEKILFKSTTVWTMDDQGLLEETDVLVEGGKIRQIGNNLDASDARIIDGRGLHLTPGIVDEHSHAALSGVNEASQTIVPEVRMTDAIDSEDIDIYRQLAGGVTTAQLLHGSANPIGGQSALVKFRWGEDPAGLVIQGSDGFIKFALGENVKQSNRPSEWVNRFPQTRMGVEQAFVDAFTRALDYQKKWDAYNTLPRSQKSSTKAPRRDLQMESMLEIINKERFISCHSYVQSEINMLMKVAERFNFTVNTFTHILEGYKVADKMAAHGAGGSTFSDWWAYKYEVKDAIPYNAVLMTQAGVVSAINSDDSEMARRLNQEAAKSIKYGNMTEWEAMKMVTINPAKLLHLDRRMGSITVGKDADLVLWTDHPLSIYAKANMTLVDGKVYYSLQSDLERREGIKKERARLIAKMRAVKTSGGKTQKGKKPEKHDWHCDDVLFDSFSEHSLNEE